MPCERGAHKIKDKQGGEWEGNEEQMGRDVGEK